MVRLTLGSDISFTGLRRIVFHARGANSVLTLACDVSTTDAIRLSGEGGIQLSSDLSTQLLVASTQGDFDFTAGSIDAQTILISAGRDLNFSQGSPLSFNTGEFELSAGRDLHVDNSLDVTGKVSHSRWPEGILILMAISA